MPISIQVQTAFRSFGHDEKMLIEAIETLALQNGKEVFQEVFMHLFRRPVDSFRAQRYWQEALARWQGQTMDQVGAKAVKTALFDYLQALVGDNLVSVKDGVTGLYTAEYLRAHLEQLIAAKRAKNQPPPLGLLQISIDQHAELYDYGYQINSDQCLRQVSKLIRKQIRNMDSAAWNENGHFSILLPDANKPQAFAVAERIRRAIEQEEFPGQWSLPGQNLTVSVGLAAYPLDAMHARRLIHHAEDQLQQAHNTGNCTSPEESERRRSERLAIHSMVEISTEGGQLSHTPAMAIDISPQGIGIGCDAAICQGNMVNLSFKRPYWPVNLEIKGQVRQANRDNNNPLPHFGLEFLNPEPGLIQPFSSSSYHI